ncbi:BtpA/SgcQ family protein [Pyrococcus kukulkanii]|uniref:BtpA/SgcQ family protein n=1 Tax=Pyrococcus kukulkanii TaxID=1609559 RepID=UPI00356A6416
MNFESKPLIGVVHLRPLPGSPRFSGNLEDVIENAIRDARAYEEAGFDAVILENFGDYPFAKEVGKETVASFAVVAKEVRRGVSIPIGINVLRNDCIAAYGIAYSAKAEFIRVNVLTGVAFTDQGIIEGCARDLAIMRRSLPGIKVFADVHVKHAVHFSRLEDALLDTVERGGADAIIVSGSRTGSEVSLNDLKTAKKVSRVPVIVGSGVNTRNLPLLAKFADGFIVGTWVKEGGVTENPVSVERAKALVRVRNDILQRQRIK